jgi:opacity protein-like surface antigen
LKWWVYEKARFLSHKSYLKQGLAGGGDQKQQPIGLKPNLYIITITNNFFSYQKRKNEMKKKLVALALLAGSTGVFAQANPFEGFSAGVGVSSVGASTTLSGADAVGGDSVNFGQQSIVPTIEVGYTHGLSKEFSLGITATYDLADTKAGSANDINVKGKNHYSINLKPGYMVGNSTMAYALVGYHATKGIISGDGESISSNYSGFGAGLGIQTLIDKNIFIKAEFQQITYNTKTGLAGADINVKPSATVGTIGIGYKF